MEAIERAARVLEEAALAPETFPAALASAAGLLGATELSLVNASGPTPAFIHSAQASEMHAAYFKGGWDRLDLRHLSFVRLGPTQGKVVSERELLSDVTRANSPFYQDFCPLFDIHHCLSWSYELDGEAWGYTLLFDSRKGSPSAHAIAGIQRLAPVAIRAGMLATKFRLARAKGIAEGLEHSGRAALVLDHEGRCVFATASAERLFDAEFGVRQSRLWAADADSNARLYYLSESIRSPLGSLTPEPLIINRGVKRRPLVIQPVRIVGENMDAWPGARVVLMLFDPSARPVADQGLLRQAFGLTNAEARVAVLVVEGLSPAEIAERLGLNVSTVRQYTKQLLAKLGVNRQAELVARLSQLAGVGGESGDGA